METIVEKITITHQGKTTIWTVVENPEKYAGRRAFLRGTSAYYDMDTFETGLSKADKVEREPYAGDNLI